jgi:hypothetical protein
MDTRSAIYGPKDFFETLASTDFRGAFTPFSPPERKQLEDYDELAGELGRRTFFGTKQRFSFKVSPEERYERFEHAGEDALRSMAMTFRRMWLDGEPTRFQTIRNLLRHHTDDSPRGVYVCVLLDELGRRYKLAGREVMMEDVAIVRTPLRQLPLWGMTETLTRETLKRYRAKLVIDAWMHSGPFHGEDEKKQAFVRRWSRSAFDYSYVKALTGHAAVMWELHLVVQGVLRPDPRFSGRA